jgi:hypothetical protein
MTSASLTRLCLVHSSTYSVRNVCGWQVPKGSQASVPDSRRLPPLRSAERLAVPPESLADLVECSVGEFVAADFDYQDLNGNPWRQPLWQLVLHVVNHSTHHRGQVAGFLRTLGRVPPPLDITVYYRETTSAM